MAGSSQSPQSTQSAQWAPSSRPASSPQPDQADLLDLVDGTTDDDTIARLTFECLVAGLDDARVQSLLNILGWRGPFSCFAVGGTPAGPFDATAVALRTAVRDLGGTSPLIGTYGTMTIMCTRVQAAVSPEVTCTAAMAAFAADRPVYLSPIRDGLPGAVRAVRETLFSLQAAPALAHAARPLRADDALPERALIGDDAAREELYRNVYEVLRGDDPGFRTVAVFLEHGGSLEPTAKELGIHPNTVRYRLKRAAETSGWDATDPRDAFVLNTALAIGRIHDAHISDPR